MKSSGPIATMWWALAFVTVVGVLGLAFGNNDLWTSEVPAAWVQAFGSIAAIVGAGWIAARQSHEAERREANVRDAAALAAADSERAKIQICSRLVTLFYVKAKTHFDLRCEEADGGETIGGGRIVHRGVHTAYRRMVAFPIWELSNPTALLAYADAIEVGDLVLAMVDDLREHEDPLEGIPVAYFSFRRQYFEKFVVELENAHQALRYVGGVDGDATARAASPDHERQP